MYLETKMKVKNTLTKKEKAELLKQLKKECELIASSIDELKKPKMDKKTIKKAYDSNLLFGQGHNTIVKFQEMLNVRGGYKTKCAVCKGEKAKNGPGTLLLGNKANSVGFKWFCSRKCLKDFVKKL